MRKLYTVKAMRQNRNLLFEKSFTTSKAAHKYADWLEWMNEKNYLIEISYGEKDENFGVIDRDTETAVAGGIKSIAAAQETVRMLKAKGLLDGGWKIVSFTTDELIAAG